MDMSQYLDIFVEESREHLQQLNSSILELEKDNHNKAVINEIFRVAHTLKGMAGTMGFTKMQALTHHMEDVLDALRNEKMSADSGMVDVLFMCLDALETYTNSIVSTGREGNEAFRDVIDLLENILKNSGKSKNSQKEETPSALSINIHNMPSASGKNLKARLNMYDMNVIKKAFASNMNVFEINVVFDKGCLLKAARAFIVFQILEKNSDIIKSEPRVEDIEDEKFEHEFTVVVITQKPEGFLIKEINSIAEIANVEVNQIVPGMIDMDDSMAETAAASQQSTISKTADRLSLHTDHDDQGSKKAHKAGKTVRVDIDRLDVLMNLVSELIIIKNSLSETNSDRDSSENDSIEYLERITTSISDAVMKVRMVPVETVFNRFPRMIRDISRDLDKDIELHVSGEETELDRTVIDEIGDPLIHILRNSADHGIESRQGRIKSGKPNKGNIYLRAFQDGNNVVIEVEDDGKGIDIQKTREKIIERGIESAEIVNSFSDKEVIEFLFKPSFSTADKVTDLSGRGVGLDVVKTKIEALGGFVDVDSTSGKGSIFIIRIPLTLAIIQALLVKIGSEKYAIPLGAIQEIDSFKPSDIRMVRNQEVVLLRNMIIPIVRLDKILSVPGAVADTEKKALTAVIVKKGDKYSAFMVDSLIGQQEIVIKSLGTILAGVKYIAGATILGDGNVALIADVNSLAL